MVSEKHLPLGYKALVEHYQLTTIPHYRWSYVTPQGRSKQEIIDGVAVYFYDQSYLPTNQTPLDHLSFALKHEGLSLHIILEVFSHLTAQEITNFITQTPTGKYTRMIWYLYELLTQTTLPLSDCTQGSYVDLLNPAHYYTTPPIKSARHRINDNMLGNQDFCPVVRKTKELEEQATHHVAQQIEVITQQFDPQIIQRANNYLFTKETMSSYAIERERPDKKRMARFIELLKKAPSLKLLTQKELIELQNVIVDQRFANTTYRTTQNYVGQQHDLKHQYIHYISPHPQDITQLMDGWFACMQRMLAADLPPLVTAATLSFSFVFLHPFDDGNGRIHRFLIHYLLACTGFTPPTTIFPVSATMLANMQEYDQALEQFSKPLLAALPDYQLDKDGLLTIQQSTKHLYAFVDYTNFVSYLSSCIKDTIINIFSHELAYLVSYDTTKKQLQNIVDMPDHKIDLLIKLVQQNDGTLSEKKAATHFAQLTKNEITQMVAVVKKLLLTKQ